MSDLAGTLQAVCDDLLTDPALRPLYSKDGKLLATYCNVALRRAAQRMGCADFDNQDLNAEAMIRTILASRKWSVVDGRAATLAALDGHLAVAFMDRAKLGEAHAHVAVVCPESMQRSGSLGRDVPIVANVGRGEGPMIDLPSGKRARKNGKCKSSAAFPTPKGEATYAIWRSA